MAHLRVTPAFIFLIFLFSFSSFFHHVYLLMFPPWSVLHKNVVS